MASMQLTAPEIPQPLPPTPCAHYPKGHLLAAFPSHWHQLWRSLLHATVSNLAVICAVTLAGLAPRCVPVLSPPSDSSRAAILILTHTHPIAHHTPPHPQHLAQSSTHRSQQLGRHASKSNRPEFKPQLCLLLAEEPQVGSHFQACFLISKMGLILPPLNSMATGRKR